MEHWWNDSYRDTEVVAEKHVPLSLFLTQIADYCQGSDPDLRGEISATNPLIHGRSKEFQSHSK